MAYWKVAGFSQPSPIEQILDKEEYTLEELLDEDDIIQECKSLNGRLISFLREKKTVEQLLRYLIEPPNDPDDPKKQYRYPFTACEVFCCEVEAVFNTLLEDEELLARLFSLLDQAPPLSCKAAGYFGRVVGQLLLRKTNEMMQYLSHNDDILAKLMGHVDTTSIADIIKRLVGADDHSSMIFSPMHTQWLAETPLIVMLLERLGPEHSPHVQANAADILTAIAHTQPSALATQLMQQQSIDALFSRALQPGSNVLVTALDVCAALLEPRRALDPGVAPGAPNGGPTDNGSPGGAGAGSSSSSSSAGGPTQPAGEAIGGMLQYLPQLMARLRDPHGGSGGDQPTASGGDQPAAGSSGGGAGSSAGAGDDGDGDGDGRITARQETPFGLLAPPLGRARLRIVELLAALLRVGGDPVDAALIEARTLPLVQELFAAYPFNNLLHHQMYALLLAVLRRGSPVMVGHVFADCQLVDWLLGLPQEVTPAPRPGSTGAAKGPLRAGYLGHVTRIGAMLQEAAAQQQEVADALAAAPAWAAFLQKLAPRLEVEDVTRWQCGRPAHMEGVELDSDGDEFPNDMESLEQMQSMPPGMYHRYGVLDDDMEEDDDEAGPDHATTFNNGGAAAAAAVASSSSDVSGSSGAGSGDAYSADMLVAGMAGLGVNDPAEAAGGADAAAGAAASGPAGDEAEAVEGSSTGQVAGMGNWSLLAHPGASSSAVDIPGERLMDDDAVLLADDEDMGALTASTLQASPTSGGGGLAAEAAAALRMDDMVLVDDADVMQQASPPGQQQAAGSPLLAGDGVAGGSGGGDVPAAPAEPAAGPAAVNAARPGSTARSPEPAGAAAVVAGAEPPAPPAQLATVAGAAAAAAAASGAAAEPAPPAAVAAAAASSSSPGSTGEGTLAADAALSPAAAAAAVQAAAAAAAPAASADVGDADAAATAVVEQVAGQKADMKGPSRDSSGKRGAMSHPVEVPEEFS